VWQSWWRWKVWHFGNSSHMVMTTLIVVLASKCYFWRFSLQSYRYVWLPDFPSFFFILNFRLNELFNSASQVETTFSEFRVYISSLVQTCDSIIFAGGGKKTCRKCPKKSIIWRVIRFVTLSLEEVFSN